MSITFDGKPCSIMVMIPARGGSKGLPRKALRQLGGKPVIAYTIADALAITGVDKVIVNTDDPEIRDAALAWGAQVPFLRPKELATDSANVADAFVYQTVWLRDHEGYLHDIAVVMSPTHPFRRPGLVDSVIAHAAGREDIYNIGSVSPAPVRLDNFWTREGGGVRRFPIPGPVDRAVFQGAFSINAVFDCRAGIKFRNRGAVLLSEVESIDLDHPEDLELARRVIDAGLYPFPDPGEAPVFPSGGDMAGE